MNVLISACLLGVDCKYNGSNNKIKLSAEELKGITFVPICPEQLGGLTTPRLPSEINELDGNGVIDDKAKVFNNAGEDVTKQFIKGAEEALKLAKLYNCEAAVLKQRSPSCGSFQIYDGNFKGKVKPGAGVTAALLERHGIKVYSEENLDEFIKKINN